MSSLAPQVRQFSITAPNAVRPDGVRPDDTRPDDAFPHREMISGAGDRADSIRPDGEASENVGAHGVRPDDTRPHGVRPHGVRPDDTRPDDTRPDDAFPHREMISGAGDRADSIRPNGEASENVGAHGVRPDDTRPHGVRPDDTRPDGVRPDDTRPDGVRPDGTSSKRPIPPRAPKSLGSFIAGFKSSVTSRAKRELYMEGIWQRNYYDHIIRNEQDFQAIWQYIDANPQKWEQDQLHPQAAPNRFNQEK